MVDTRFKKPVVRYKVQARRKKDEPIVKNGLAITPAAMVELMQQGSPISAQAYSIKQETPSQANDFFVPAEHQRHFDMVDGWNARLDAQEKVRGIKKKIARGEIETQATE